MEIAEQGTLIDASRRSSPSHAGNLCQLRSYLPRHPSRPTGGTSVDCGGCRT